jgi:hypothetical protein
MSINDCPKCGVAVYWKVYGANHKIVTGVCPRCGTKSKKSIGSYSKYYCTKCHKEHKRNSVIGREHNK